MNGKWWYDNKGSDDYLIQFKPTTKKVTFYFLGAWEKEPNGIKTEKEFLKYELVNYFLSEDGIKKYILKNIVPSLNNKLTQLLSTLDLSISVIFNEDFKPIIYRNSKIASVGSISTGQKKMIDTCIYIVMVYILNNKFKNVNISYIDEALSSLHVTKIPEVVQLVVDNLVKDLNMNVLIVNHSFMSGSMIDEYMHLQKEGSFTKISFSKEY